MVWTVCGVVIGLSRPLSDSGRGAASPFVGWLIVAFGIYLIVSGFRRAADPPGGEPRHSSGRWADPRDAMRFPLAFAMLFAVGAGFVWWGVASGRAVLVCLGIVCGSLCVFGVPEGVQALRSRLRR